jgi:hypothetical protein
MKKILLLPCFVCIFVLPGLNVAGNVLINPDSLTSGFTLPEIGCIQQHVNITYTGNAPPAAVYLWNFGGAVVLSGSGQGPYVVKWETAGIKTVTLTVEWEAHTSTTSKQIHIKPLPAIFHMTGGGSYPAGGNGVEVGLSDSEDGVFYTLRRNGIATNIILTGTGNPISFGLIMEPGNYSAIANNSPCLREMEGTAVVTIINPPFPYICMVSFDTISHKNKVVWNKTESLLINQVNIFKETSQNEFYEKIAEVPYSNPGIFLDTNSYPLVRSYKYRISFVDTNNHESEKSPYHKTIHLNINAGIYGFNLIWNHYEGFEFLTYNIYRKIGTEPFIKIASVASNVNSYTDFYVTSGIVTYYIQVLRPEPCHPELRSGDYSTIVSNIAAAAPLGIEENDQSGVIIYPNPAHDKVMVVVNPGHEKITTLELFRPNGQLILNTKFSDLRTELDLSNLEPGVYFVRISFDNSILVRKIVRD